MSRQIALALGLCVGACGIAWAQDHTLRSDHVMINTRSHWNNWNFVSGTLGISATGEVAPVFVPKANNAVLDIVSHIRRANANPEATILDAIEAGSNQADVVNLFDGDETTYWEPDPRRSDTGLVVPSGPGSSDQRDQYGTSSCRRRG